MDERSKFSVALQPAPSRALDRLRRHGLPPGCRPYSKGSIVERALLALAAAEGIDVTEEG